MSMEGDLAAAIAADSSIIGVLGSGAQDLIFPQKVAQGTPFPNIRYAKISGLRDRYVALGSPDGSVRARMQYDCRGLSSASAKSLFLVLKDVLYTFEGYTVGSTPILAVNIENERDTEEPYGDGSDTVIYITTADALILYEE